jgi:hypothetical protein
MRSLTRRRSPTRTPPARARFRRTRPPPPLPRARGRPVGDAAHAQQGGDAGPRVLSLSLFAEAGSMRSSEAARVDGPPGPRDSDGWAMRRRTACWGAGPDGRPTALGPDAHHHGWACRPARNPGSGRVAASRRPGATPGRAGPPPPRLGPLGAGDSESIRGPARDPGAAAGRRRRPAAQRRRVAAALRFIGGFSRGHPSRARVALRVVRPPAGAPAGTARGPPACDRPARPEPAVGGRLGERSATGRSRLAAGPGRRSGTIRSTPARSGPGQN